MNDQLEALARALIESLTAGRSFTLPALSLYEFRAFLATYKRLSA